MTTHDYQVISSIVRISINIHLTQRIPLLLPFYDNIVEDSAPDFSRKVPWYLKVPDLHNFGSKSSRCCTIQKM